MPIPPAAPEVVPLPSTVLRPVLPLDYGPRTRFRWVILALVFGAITINCIDRMILGILAPGLMEQFHIGKPAFGAITAAFGIAYALGQMASGRWLDWVGTRVGYAAALFSWSVASMLHALAASALSFGFMRALLGVTESPAFPAAAKTLAEWFPKKERALAMGIVNSGSNVGAVVAPIAVPWLALNYGWQWSFIITGGLGLLWLLFWIPLYRRPHEHPRVSPAELAYINSDPPEATGKVRWVRLLTYRQTWAFALGKFLSDPVWSFYMFWFPMFLKDRHHVDLSHVGMPLVLAYLMADAGSIGGGWLSSTLIKRGWSINAARKVTLAACALCVLPSVFSSLVAGLWTSVFLIGLALAGHQGFSSNLYTLVSDMFPRRAVGSVSGLGGTFGYLGYALFGVLTGWIVQRTGGNYLPVFIITGTAYTLAVILIHSLAPRLAPAAIGDGNPESPPSGFEVGAPHGNRDGMQ